MENKQHNAKQLIGQRRNQKGNQKRSWNKQNGNTTYQKFIGCSKSTSK